MFETFLNPGYLAAGAALVSLPILIHLINRMRFKRIRWAAMEFLLKSQKKNRRRLIIEQLILLALRCLLVMLAVLLVSRYLGFSFAFFEPQNTVHVVVLDDTLSMSDRWIEEGESKNCFQTGKDLIVKEIAKNAVQARTAQRLVLVPLSEPGRKPFDQRLNDQSIQDLEKALGDLTCSSLRIDLTRGIEAASELFGKNPQDRRILHVVSDFRQRDWSEPDSASLSKALDDLGRAQVKINLIDTAHPYRNDIQKTPLHHDNLAIIELQPETRVAARDMPVQFNVTVANYGTSERKNLRIRVNVNGTERLEGSVMVTVPPSGSKTETFQIAFDQLGFNQITANLEGEDVGLQGDNVRYAVIDVRKQVPVLVVDGDPANGQKPGGDTFHIQTLFGAARGFQIAPRAVNELEQSNLDQYASIYLLNVRELSDKALKNLESYVRDGGSVAFFLGERVRPDFYNEKLYRQGKGVFPAPLADRPYPSLSDPELEPNLFDGQLKLFVRVETNPIFAEVWKPNYRHFFDFLSIRRYFQVPRRLWEKTPGLVEELVTLPNQKSTRDYAGEAQEILDNIGQLGADPKNEKYRTGLEAHQRAIRDSLIGDKPLYLLANALEALLKDPGEKGNDKKPSLVEFWKQLDYLKLRGRIDQFRETVQLGDPLVIASRFGKGRVVAFLTTAGRAWNDWAGGSLAAATYPAVMVELQKYLTSSGGEMSRVLGSPLTIDVDASRYEPRIRATYQPETREQGGARPPGNATGGEKETGLIDKGEILGLEAAGRTRFTFEAANKPGLYRFDLTPRLDKGTPDGTAKTEPRAYAFNVDTTESDLRRAAKDDLEKSAAGAQVRNPASGWANELANRQNDLSESAWFYLLFLVILIIEQAMAVHLSFHLKGSDATITATRPPKPAAA